jgi:Tol biopolymer transport system component
MVSLIAPWRPNLPPAWSPDGRLIAVATVEIGPRPSGGTILFVDSRNGAIEQKAEVPTGLTVGLSWLDARSLVVNQPLQTGATNQLFRLPYPAGPLSRLTNDPNSYVGVSLTGDRASLVTAQRDARMDIWVGDGTGATGSEVVQRAPTGIVERLAWSGDRLLYGTLLGGKPAIARLTPGKTTPEGVVSDAATPAATADGRAILFVSTATEDNLSLWMAECGGRRVTRLATEITASHLAVTPDDRFVLFTSLASGTLSIYMVSIDGGAPTKLADGSSPAISPDGGSLLFTAPPADTRSSLMVCSLPGCRSPHPVGSAALDAPVGWMPSGRGVAYAVGSNLGVQALDGSAPRQLTRIADSRPIGHFAWSSDGTRLAIARGTVTNDIVHFTGLR